MNAHVGAHAHTRQRLALGEDLGVRTDADLQILAPGPGRDQGLLQSRSFRRARLQPMQVVADQVADMVANARRRRQIAARPFLDHPFQH
ncbi:hypothetical protein D3C85_1551070 [compost metagenome]